ncbi:MAG: hypothetical protein B6D61_14980, partial [Bacteroidetes bacterium 4484_249]
QPINKLHKLISNNYINKLKSNIFLKNVLIIATGTAAGQAISILAAPVITRIYTPEDYGIFTTFMAIIGVTGSFSTLRYAVAIPVAENDKLADNALRLSFFVTFSLTLLITFIIFTSGHFLLNLFSATRLSSFLWIIPIAFLGTGTYSALNFWALRKKNFKTITKAKIYQGAFGAGFKIGLGWIGLRPVGLLIGILAQQLAGIGSLMLKLIKEEPGFFNHFQKDEILYAAKRFKDFPLYQTWSQILLSLGPQLPVFFIAAYFGSETVGLYGLAFSMVSIPLNLLGTSVSQVYFAEIAQYGKNRPDKIFQLSKSIIKKMSLVGIFPLAIIMVFGPYIFSLVFGPEWSDAGIYARLLSLMILLRFISSPIMNCLNVLELQWIQLLLNIIRVIIVIITFALCIYFAMSAKTTILFYSIAMSIYYGMVTVFTFILLRNK